MNVEIKAINMELTASLREYVEKKVEMLEKFMSIPHAPQDQTAFIELEKLTGEHHKKGDVFRAVLQFDLGVQLLRVEKISQDMYKSIEKVKDEMERQLIRYKERLVDKQRRND